MDHSFFDKRNYPIVDVQTGYGEWVKTYEGIVQDEMDLRLLERLKSVNWSEVGNVLDLACGTGRIGAWLREQGATSIDGVDLTPQMLAKAEEKGIYKALYNADVTATGLPDQSYDLCTQSLADEHMPDLKPLYAEVARLTKPNGQFVIVGYHSHFLLDGVPTHFEPRPNEPITIRSYVHFMSDHVKAAHAAGWTLREMEEGLIDEAWLLKKPKWEHKLGLPVSFVIVWGR